MYCTYCGKPNADDSRFCGYCGKPLEDYAPPADVGRAQERAPSSRSGKWVALVLSLFVFLAAGSALWFLRPKAPTLPKEYAYSKSYYTAEIFADNGLESASLADICQTCDEFTPTDQLGRRSLRNLLGFVVSSTEYTYDSEGRVTRETAYEYGSLASTKDYSFRADGSPIGWTVSDASGRTTETAEYSYDADDRLSSILAHDSSGTVTAVYSYEYDLGNVEMRETITENGETRIVDHVEDGVIVHTTPYPGAAVDLIYEESQNGELRLFRSEQYQNGEEVGMAEAHYGLDGNYIGLSYNRYDFDYHVTSTCLYGDDGRLTGVNTYESGSGNTKLSLYYDDRGQLLSAIRELPSGKVVSTQIERLAYGRVQCTITVDDETRVELYDKDGRLIS